MAGSSGEHLGSASCPDGHARDFDALLACFRQSLAGTSESGPVSTIDGGTPTVAVVVPCYNHGAFVRETVESVRRQDWPAVDCIVVDDGSTDELTLRVLDQLRAEGTRVLRQENQGLAAARNAGIRATDAPFFVPLDADDTIAPRLISTLLPCLLRNSRLGYCYCHAVLFGAVEGEWKSPPYDPRELLTQNLSTATAVVRRRAFDLAGGYRDDMVHGFEDWDFWVSLLSIGYFGHCVPEPLFFYRKHPAGRSMLATAQAHRTEMIQKIVDHHRRLYETAFGSASPDEKSVAVLSAELCAKTELDRILKSRSWRMVQRLERLFRFRRAARAGDAEAAPDSRPVPARVRLASIQASRPYRWIQSAKATALYRWYARRKYGEAYVEPGAALPPAAPQDTSGTQTGLPTCTPRHGSGRSGMSCVILTRNAGYGGVESIVAVQSAGLAAPVIVTGGRDDRAACPFRYTRADTYDDLGKQLAGYDVALYHWLPSWAVKAVADSGIASVEFVHRTDTADNDKTVPTALIAHSDFLAEWLEKTSGRRCEVVQHPIDTLRFAPARQPGDCVGAVTSYLETKGIDIFLHAWKRIAREFPHLQVRFHGGGSEQRKLQNLARQLGIKAQFLPATAEPWKVMADFRCVVIPSRLEGLPMTAVEALAMDITVVASDLPGMVEFNRLAESRGLAAPIMTFPKENPEALADTLRAVLSDSNRPDTHAYVQRFYGIQEHCRHLARILHEAVASHARKTREVILCRTWHSQNTPHNSATDLDLFLVGCRALKPDCPSDPTGLCSTDITCDCYVGFQIDLPAGGAALECEVHLVPTSSDLGMASFQVEWLDRANTQLAFQASLVTISRSAQASTTYEIPDGAVLAAVTFRPYAQVPPVRLERVCVRILRTRSRVGSSMDAPCL